MPIISTSMSSSMKAKAASSAVYGRDLGKIAGAISGAITQFFLTTATVVSTNIATGPGAGTGTGRLVGMVPSSLGSTMTLVASGFGLVGRDIRKLMNAVAFGVVQGMRTAVAQGTVIGAGPGTGIGNIVGLLPVVLTPLISAQLAGRGIVGPSSFQISSAISVAVCTYFMTAVKVQLTDVGAFAPPPAGPIPIPAAPGIGKLL